MEAAPTAAKISRRLATRYTRSESWAGQVKGYRSTSRGFKVRTMKSGAVEVTHQCGGMWKEDHAAETAKRISAYAEFLTDEGFNVETVDLDRSPRLLCR